ncbi:hypothetical protein EAH89_21190 [Roseomonas nepalensis]|uniref:Right handed beta helix domain-containing protein n=1 Tax=Muricoccus nepalensis TaxID=1854500 RepID=A0A502FJD1_9PROT|nr:carbohydrate-binding domain-containing protein [Roseomonas nepalensis]TPG49531.1 hypothetical protein EAH89_21190 [Roseomonas nepalensis]
MSTLTVGAGQQYSTIASAVAASRDGDVLAVQAGTYRNDFANIDKKLTIEGVGGVARLEASGDIPNGKGILMVNTDVTIKNLAFSGATVADGNGAGIRFQGGNLTIENSLFENNQNGLLTNTMPGSTLTIRNSEFSHNGTGDGRTHNIYVGEIGKLSIDNSYFHDAVVGHEIKSRSYETVITNSRIAEGADGTGSYSIDLPNGGSAYIAGNTIQQGEHSQNPAMIHFGGESGPYPGSSLTVTNNTFVNDLPSQSAVAVLNQTGVLASVTGNATYGIASDLVAFGAAQVSNVTTLVVRPLIDLLHSVDAPAAPAPAPAPVAAAPVVTPDPAPAPAPSPSPAAGPGDLVLRVSEDAWQGHAQFTVSVDGAQVGGVRTASASHAAGQHDDVVIPGLPAGAHAVAVTFLNDAWGGSAAADRNLYVDSVSYAGEEKGIGAVLLSSGASATTTVGAAAPAPAPEAAGGHSLTLHLAEDAWRGDAQFAVMADGKQVGGGTVTASHAAGAVQDFTFNLPSAPSTVDVAFLNDAWGGTAGTDRNLYVAGFSVDGHEQPGATAALMSAGTAHFNVDPWA